MSLELQGVLVFSLSNLGILHKVNSCYFKRNLGYAEPKADWKSFETCILRYAA